MSLQDPPAWMSEAPPPSSLDDSDAALGLPKTTRDGAAVATSKLSPSARLARAEARASDENEPRRAVILDRRDPMPSALGLIADRYVSGKMRILQHYRGVFYQWHGGCYQQIDGDAVQAGIWDFLKWALHRTDNELKPFQPNRARVGDVQAALAAACNLPAHIEAPTWLAGSDELPPADEFLPVTNGLLHLPSGELYPPTPAYFGLNCAGVAYDPDAPEPKEWLRFLDQIWGEDRQSIETLQDLFGYLLSSDTSQQKIGLIVGPKRSGKGTIAHVLTRLLGQNSVAAPTLASLAMNFGLAPLIGKSLAIIGDARLSARSDQAAIAERLLSISGEDAITIDRKFLTGWTGRLGVRFLVMTNELPRLADASGALASRFVVLTMERSFFGKEDRGLRNRLIGELPGILNWALAGYRGLRERGYFMQPESAADAIAELEALGSPVSAFVKARCAVAPGLQCAPERLFSEWRLWCEANGREKPGTAQTFGRDIRAAVPGLRVSQPRVGGKQVRMYEGIALRDVNEPEGEF
jgi:putative DNA primase/helicase